MLKTRRKRRARILNQQGGRCFYCLKPLSIMVATTDHFFPVSRGGDNHVLNKVCACPRCNREKGDRMPNEAEIERISTWKRIPAVYYRAMLAYLGNTAPREQGYA